MKRRQILMAAAGLAGLLSQLALGGTLPVHNVTQDTWHATIQAAIDAAAAGDTLSVYPGNYDETASGRYILAPSGMGPYQFGLFIPHDKPGLTIQGVDAGGSPITSAAAVVAHITTNATNPFGYSGTFLEADNTTLTGLDFGPNAAGTNKTIEVIADNLIIRHCIISDVESGYGGGSLYINDWQYDDNGTPGDTSDDSSHIRKYRVEGCYFPNGASIDLADGAGFSGPPADRQIIDNTFDLSYSEFAVTWPVISFNGSDTGVPWFRWSVGGAAITGNTFQYGPGALQYIRARGTYDNSQFDWSSYWSSNQYDKAVVFGAAPPATLGVYSVVAFYGPIHNIRRIGATIQGEIDHAAAGDTVLAAAGLYEEQVIIDGLDDLTLRGSGSGANPATSTIVRSPLAASLATTPAWGGSVRPIIAVLDATGVTLDNLRVDGFNRCTCGSDMVGVSYWEAGGVIEDCVVTNVRDNPLSGCQDGVALHADNASSGPFTLAVIRTHLREYQKNGTAFAGIGRTITMTDCTVTGSGPSPVIAQNGVQIAYGAGGVLTRCDIREHFWTGPTWAASGVLAYGTSGVVDLVECDLINNQISYFAVITAGGQITATDFRNPAEPVVAPGGYQSTAAYLYTDGSAVDGTVAFTRAAKYGPDRPVAVDGGVPMDVTFRHSRFLGSDAADTVGLWSAAEGGVLNVTLEHCLVRDWDYGLIADEDGGAVTTHAHHNTIASNLTMGFYTTPPTTTVQQAVNNYWGADGGPADPGGTIETDGSSCPDVTDITNQVGALGNGVSDNTVEYCPWLAAPATISLVPQGGDVCYEPGDTLVVEVQLSASKTVIVGGQFYLNYDTSRLTYVNGEPAVAICPPPGANPFCTELLDFTPSPGTIFYSVGVNPAGGVGTAADAVMARLTFTVNDPLPATCQLAGLVGFQPDLGGLQTKLSDSFGAQVTPLKNPLPAISVDDTSPVIDPVAVVGGSVDGSCERLVTFSTTVNDECCLSPDGITGSAMILSGAVTLSGFTISGVAVDGDTVTVSGSVLVSAITACPVIVEITVNATDCCGHAASLSGTAAVTDDAAPTFVPACPLPAILVNSDANTGCGAAAAFVNPVAPAALDNCDSAVSVVGTRSDSEPLSAVYPVGTTTITWTATDACGNEATCTQDVIVSSSNVLNVTVELSPAQAGPQTRCITFRLYRCAPASVVEIERVLSFNGAGIATDSFEIPCGVYECVTARDRLHTLRSTDEPMILSGAYYVSFTGARPDEAAPGVGNRLLGGNLNDDFYIDILDFGVYTFQYASSYGPGGTTCLTPYPHADINGDGTVGTPDFTFILINFLRGHQPNCCALADGQEDEGGHGPLLRIAVADLAARGLSHLAVADLNRDGWLDVADIGAFLEGALPRLPGENLETLPELKRIYRENLLGLLGPAGPGPAGSLKNEVRVEHQADAPAGAAPMQEEKK